MHVLGAGVALLGQQRRQHAALGRQRVDGVLHHGQLAGGHRAEWWQWRERGDADGVLHLLRVEVEHARRRRSGEAKAVSVAWCQPRSRMPGKAASHSRISNSWPRTMPTIRSRPPLAGALAAGQRRGDDVRGVRRVLLPVDVVVVHHPDHQRVERATPRPGPALAGADHRGRAAAGDLVEHLAGRSSRRAAGSRRGRSPASRAGSAWPRRRPRGEDPRNGCRRPSRRGSGSRS